jgi:hypothetical protein
MAKYRPDQLILRCYGYRSSEGPYIGVCVDLNIAVQADSPSTVRAKMADAIVSYIETVYETDDRASISALMSRRAPTQDWLIYYVIRTVLLVKKFRDNFTFKEPIPIHLAHSC